MSKFVPVAELAKKASKPYPGDSDDYRKARTALLEQRHDGLSGPDARVLVGNRNKSNDQEHDLSLV
jgi:hypothetical protein